MDDCIIHAGCTDRAGYGHERYLGRQDKAHRVAWKKAKGPIPPGMFVCHACDTPSCVNVEHLFLGTHCDNMADMAAKGRSLRGDRNPCAKLTERDVQIIRLLVGRIGLPQKEVAARYGVNNSQVTRIVRRERWRHVADIDLTSERGACIAA